MASSSSSADAQTPTATLPLIPEPRSVRWGESPAGDWVTEDPFRDVAVGLSGDLPREEYSLSVHARGAAITAGSEAALADGRNAFAQIVHLAVAKSRAAGLSDSPQYRIPPVVISDAPTSPWRGLLVDPARHFLPIDELRRLIDAMALYRLNVLQLNLTDDQGWRIEIEGYPKLTEVGAWRERTVEGVPAFDDTDSYSWESHGGFYTQSELKDLVQFAEARGVRIVPGVNLPGHVQAAVAAYPNLGNYPDKQLLVRETWGVSQHVLGTSDVAFQFVRDVLEQVTEIFPSRFVAIGGHDVPLTEWEQAPSARAKRAEWGYTRASEILGRFTTFAAEVLAEKGRRIVAFDDADLVRLPDSAVLLANGDSSHVAKLLKRGFPVVAAPRDTLGFDHMQSADDPVGLRPLVTLKDVFDAKVLPAKLPEGAAPRLLGTQATVFGEYIPTGTHLGYMLFPRLAAYAQRAWAASDLSWDEFRERAVEHERLYDALGVESRVVVTE